LLALSIPSQLVHIHKLVVSRVSDWLPGHFSTAAFPTRASFNHIDDAASKHGYNYLYAKDQPWRPTSYVDDDPIPAGS
jgi:hypothetical protein